MKKNILIQVGERTEIRERIIPAVYDENSEIVTEETVEQYTVTVPIMQVQTVDMTSEEIAEFERQQAELPEPEPTTEEQLADLSDYVDCLAEMVLGGASYGN